MGYCAMSSPQLIQEPISISTEKCYPLYRIAHPADTCHIT